MEQIIQLAPDDDITAIRSRLEWTDAERVLMVVPGQNKSLRNLVNLKILARVADNRNIKLALVTQNFQVRDLCKEAGIKVFATEWVARRFGFIGGSAPKSSPEETAPPQLQLVETTAPPRVRIQDKKLVLVVGSGRVGFFQQVAALLLVSILALAVVVIFLAIAPEATVTLTPQVGLISNELLVTADPNPEVTEVNRETLVVPAEPVQVELNIFDEVETIDVQAAPVGFARGRVVFFNRTQNEQFIPISTTVRTSSGVPVEFVTTQTATIPAGTGATTGVSIRAVEPGPSGNVPAGQINRFSSPTLGLLARVINESSLGGGSVELAGVVTEADKLRLRSKLRQIIQQKGYEAILASLDEETFVPPESLQVIELALSYNRFSGDVAPNLGGEMRAVVRATAVSSFQVNQLAYFDLLEQIPDGRILLPDDLSFKAGRVEAINDRAVSFKVMGEGIVVYEIDKDFVRQQVAGMAIGKSQAWMSENLPVVSVPGVDVAPNWLGRLPVFPFRINVVINDVTQRLMIP